MPPPPPPAAAKPGSTVEPTTQDRFPIGWQLTKESWHFHRKFHRLFRRPMREGEYSHLLWQVRRRTAEHLGENYWRVTLPDRRTKLAIVANADHHPAEGLETAPGGGSRGAGVDRRRIGRAGAEEEKRAVRANQLRAVDHLNYGSHSLSQRSWSAWDCSSS
ncbi:MAG TPA: hypothetical protein VFL55_06665 [Acetobacteraceae bacterium]|nr:hypothetical protein [Acetobacteraceae bacterium]